MFRRYGSWSVFLFCLFFSSGDLCVLKFCKIGGKRFWYNSLSQNSSDWVTWNQVLFRVNEKLSNLEYAINFDPSNHTANDELRIYEQLKAEATAKIIKIEESIKSGSKK